MVKFVDQVLSFLQYWYFRYTLVTELYIVEGWERKFTNIFLVLLFSLVFYFNYKVILPATSHFLQN